jgi:hypothetical protein
MGIGSGSTPCEGNELQRLFDDSLWLGKGKNVKKVSSLAKLAIAFCFAGAAFAQQIPEVARTYYVVAQVGLTICQGQITSELTGKEFNSNLARLGSSRQIVVEKPDPGCVIKLRTDLKNQYESLMGNLPAQTAKAALKDHYVAVRKTIDELALVPGEPQRTYDRRFEDNSRKINEMWIRFVVEIE